jgi:hypothetical protein
MQHLVWNKIVFMHLWTTRRSMLFFGLAIVLALATASIWHPWRLARSAPRSNRPIADWKREAPPIFTAKLSPDKTLIVNLQDSLLPSMEPLLMTYRATRLRVGEMECDPMDLGGGSRNIPNWAVQGGGSGDRTIPLVKVPEQLAPGGPMTLVCAVEIVIYKDSDTRQPPETLARFTTDCKATVEIPPGLLPVREIHDETVRRNLEEELHVNPLEVRINDPNQPNYRVFRWNLTIDGPAAPLNVSYDVELRSPELQLRWKIGEFACAKGERIHYEVTKEGMAGRPGEKFDLILTPSTSAAARHDLQNILSDTIVLHGIRKLVGVE